MTRKNKAKNEARARQARHGGSYTHHLAATTGSGGREPTVREHVERILELARICERAYEAWKARTPDQDAYMREHMLLLRRRRDPSLRPDVTEEALAHQDADRALLSALRALPVDVLRKVQAIMYMGRGDNDFGSLLHGLRGEPHVVRAIAVADKGPLAEYLEEGLRLVDEGGVDVEAKLTDGAPELHDSEGR